jgi:hypothetical protein
VVDFDGGVVVWDDLIPGDYVVSEVDPGVEWNVSGVGTVTVNPGLPCTQVMINNTMIADPCINIIKNVSSDNTNWTNFESFYRGSTIYWRIMIKNCGNVALNDVTIIDDNNQMYGPLALTSGEEMTFYYSTIALDNISNTANVTGHGPYNTIVSDSDSAVVEIMTPAVNVTKYVWDGYAWTDSIRSPVGAFLNFKIVITNNGDVPIADIIVNDTMASPQLQYRNQANYVPTYASSNLVIWNFDMLEAGNTIEILYQAETVHTCYGWNHVNVTIAGGYSYEDEVIVKVIFDEQPIIDIKKEVWDTGIDDWVEIITRTVGTNLSFKLTLYSSAMETINDIDIVDDLPLFLEYRYCSNYPEQYVSDDLHQVIWHIDEIHLNETIEIYYHAQIIGSGWDGNFVSLSSGQYYDEDSVLIKSINIPLTQIVYPIGGETLSGITTVRWFALKTETQDELGMYLYYSENDGQTWVYLAGPIGDTHGDGPGEYRWSTTSVTDGNYRLKVIASKKGAVAFDTSGIFTVNNGIVDARVSSVSIIDTDIGSNQYVKDGDVIKVTAGITGGSNIIDVYADLSGFGGSSNAHADKFDGYVATWILDHVVCHPTNGKVTVTIQLDNGMSGTTTITSDNTDPTMQIVKPKNGLYLFNSRLLPTGNTVIIGGITIDVDVSDESGIRSVEFYLDDELQHTVTTGNSEWYLNEKLMGKHTLKIIVYDIAGNTNMISKEVRIINPHGS